MRRVLLSLMLLGASVVAGGVLTAGPAAAAGARITYTYVVRGLDNTSSLESFAAQAAATYADPRGWNLGGSIAFRRVSSGGDYTLWLAAAGDVPGFGSPCDSSYSCTSGRNVIINESRWLTGSPSWNATGAALADYRHMVVNHETGHWLGFAHEYCAGAGQLAPVMQQQSISMQGCRPNAWPTGSERQRLATSRDVPIVSGSPVGTVDSIAPGLAAFTVRGWSIDPDTTKPVTLTVLLDQGRFNVVANAVRTDVGKAYPGYGNGHGFAVTHNVTPGRHAVCVSALNTAGTGGTVSLGCHAITVSGNPIGRLDTVTIVGHTVVARGWALDPDSSQPIPVTVVETVGPKVVVLGNVTRPDLVAGYRRWGAAHGFAASLPTATGTRKVCAYAANKYGTGSTAALGCRTVRVP